MTATRHRYPQILEDTLGAPPVALESVIHAPASVDVRVFAVAADVAGCPDDAALLYFAADARERGRRVVALQAPDALLASWKSAPAGARRLPLIAEGGTHATSWQFAPMEGSFIKTVPAPLVLACSIDPAESHRLGTILRVALGRDAGEALTVVGSVDPDRSVEG